MGTEKSSCCSPGRNGNAMPPDGPIAKGMPQIPMPTVAIPGGIGLLGTNAPMIPDDGEGPLRRKKLKPFRMACGTGTNAAFAEFVGATGYLTEAERIGWSFVFFSDVPKHIRKIQGVQGIEWWRKVDGAAWRTPHGPEASSLMPDHPVVQVSWNDAVALMRINSCFQ